MAVRISAAMQDLPIYAKRDVLSAIGIASCEAREISRWVAMGILLPDSLSALPDVSTWCSSSVSGADACQDQVHIVPSIDSVIQALEVLMDHLWEEAPDHSLVDHQIACVYEVLADINALVDILPLTKDDRDHETELLRTLINRADHKIS
jgi:hypothetical protein